MIFRSSGNPAVDFSSGPKADDGTLVSGGESMVAIPVSCPNNKWMEELNYIPDTPCLSYTWTPQTTPTDLVNIPYMECLSIHWGVL